MLRILLCMIIMSQWFLACKKISVNSSNEQSITTRKQTAGKWLATITIGGPIQKNEAELMSKILKKVFMGDRGGQYRLAFSLSDKSGWIPSKTDILKNFSNLKSSIAEYKFKNPGSPTMVVIGLIGHGMSRQAFAKTSDEYIFVVKHGMSESIYPEEYFSGTELANQIASLGAEEVLVFVQSCNSGGLSNTDFMNKYAQILTNETAKQRTNIAVITPVNDVIFSPTEAIEFALGQALIRLSEANADVGTYAAFKDNFVRAVCEDERYYPRSEIKNLAAVQAATTLLEVESLIGIDPQFYESIDPNLPLILTNQGISKYYNDTLQLPAKLPAINHVPISSETKKFCAEKIATRAQYFQQQEEIRLSYLKLVSTCELQANKKEACLENLRKNISNTPAVTNPLLLETPHP